MLVWSGVTNAGVLSTVQSLVGGQKPIPGQPQASILKGKNVGLTNAGFSTGVGGGSGNSRIADEAQRLVGDVYTWGGSQPSEDYGGPKGRKEGCDCYGLLTWVLHSRLGYNLPNNTHSGYLEFLAWSGASRVSSKDIQAGDLIIWPTHSGIAINSTQMVSAENPRDGVKVNTFNGGGPLAPEPMTVLRVNGEMVSA